MVLVSGDSQMYDRHGVVTFGIVPLVVGMQGGDLLRSEKQCRRAGRFDGGDVDSIGHGVLL